jgi:hypothetical protein
MTLVVERPKTAGLRLIVRAHVIQPPALSGCAVLHQSLVERLSLAGDYKANSFTGSRTREL